MNSIFDIHTYHRTYVTAMKRILDQDNVMLFLMGARQVGKTTLSQLIAQNYVQKAYFNWDVDEHRQQILSGQKFIEAIFPTQRIGPKPLVIFDELHKYEHWKNYIKGFYDLYKNDYHSSFCISGDQRNALCKL